MITKKWSLDYDLTENHRKRKWNVLYLPILRVLEMSYTENNYKSFFSLNTYILLKSKNSVNNAVCHPLTIIKTATLHRITSDKVGGIIF